MRVISFKVKYILITVWLSSLYVVAMLIFVRGMLLHRDVLTRSSFCRNDSFSFCFASRIGIESPNCLQHYNSSNEGQYCIPTNFKAILLVIDALRFDFVEYQTVEREHATPYHNKLKSVTDLLATKSEHTRLFRFIADPPTTTMQRIKALTTGSLPTFIDVGSNFASAEIDEDNLIDIMIRERKNVVFLGDDTWTKLYPSRFNRSFPFDSFNVWDLDTVDRGIRRHLIPEIRKADWHLIIAHFLGVDHCGHRYGPNHPEMERKLLEMDFVIREVIEEIQTRDDVTLFVIGDHGMTTTGDHGGETENEVTTALFAYSPVHPFFSDTRRESNLVSQVDIVPTLSTIIGVPIPFSNTGRIVLECVPHTILRSLTTASLILWQSIEQTTKYVNEYSLRNKQFESVLKEEVFVEYEELKSRWFSIEKTDQFREFVNEYDHYMKGILEMCRKVWIQFNFPLIAVGITFMFLTLILCVIVANRTKTEMPVDIVLVFYSSGVFVLSLLTLPVYSALIVYEVFSLMCLFRNCFPLSYALPKMKGIHVYVIFCNVCLASALFSNSFILEEPSVVLFFLMSCLWLTFASRWKRISGGHFFATNIAYRIGFSVLSCREEQKHCRNSLLEDRYNAKYPFLAAIGFAFAAKTWSEATRRHKSTLFALVTKACMLCVIVFWMKDSVGEYAIVLDAIPAAVFAVCLVTVCALIYDPVLNAGIVESASRARIARANISLILCIACSVLLDSSVSVSSVSMLLSLHHLDAILANVGTFGTGSNKDILWSSIILWSMSAVYWFYATGHYASFSAIQWNAAFLFQKDIGSNILVPGVLVTMNTFVAYIVHGFLLPIVSAPSEGSSLENRTFQYNSYLLRSTSMYLKYVTIFAFRLLTMMTVCALHSRHLMMWQIFAPKFIFEAIAFLITIASSTIGLIFVYRIYG